METMAYLRPPRGLPGRFLIALTLVCCLTGGASATAGLRPDPKPQPQPRPEPPPQARVSPQPPPAQPPPVQAPAPEPARPVVVGTQSRPAATTHRPKSRPTRNARRTGNGAAVRPRSERTTVGRTAARGTSRPAVRAVAPITVSDSKSNVGSVLLIAMVALAAALLLFGFGVTPARAARWPAAARALENQGDVLVTTGFAILAASGVLLVFFLIVPA